MSPTSRISTALLLAPFALALAQQSEAPIAARSRFPSVQVEEVRQKLTLVEALLNKSPVMARIAESQNQKAKDQAQTAREHYQRAQDALSQADAAAADGHLNDALRLLSSASQAAPDPKHTLQEQRAEYAQLVQKIESFQVSLASIQQRQHVKQKVDTGVAAELERIRTMIAAAAALEKDGDYRSANRMLSEAHDIGVAAINKLVAGETFVYDLRFASAAEEFRYELERHRSYEELIPIAVATLHPSPAANRLIDNYFQQSEQLKAKAQQEAAKGEHSNALSSMRAAIDYLQKALQAVGIVVPQSIEQ